MLVEDLPVAVLVIDRDERVTAANPATATLTGYSPGYLIGRSIVETLRPRSPDGGEALISGWHSSAELGNVKRFREHEVVVRRADGAEIELLIDGGYNRDASRKLVGATLLLRPCNHGSRQPSSGVGIVSAVSHELRSPLTSVRGYTSLLLKRWNDVRDDDRREMLVQIDRDARRISRMIGELLDVTRIEGGRVQLNCVELDVPAVIKDVLANLENVWPELEVELSFPNDFPRAGADPDKITQVVTNLLENACKYANPKGIEIRGSVVGENVVVDVTDRGPGIPEKDMPRLFQQFFNSREGRPSGTGLGLWISRGLIEAHGGEMTARSIVNEGTTFRFTLPKTTQQAAADNTSTWQRFTIQ